MEKESGLRPPPTIPPGPERDALVLESFSKSCAFLDEAKSLSPKTHALSMAHDCCYAMLWLARAVISQKFGTYTWRHETTDGRLRDIAADYGVDAPIHQAYSIFKSAESYRLKGDYDRTYRPSVLALEQLLEDTERAIDMLNEHYNLDGMSDIRILFDAAIRLAPKVFAALQDHAAVSKIESFLNSRRATTTDREKFKEFRKEFDLYRSSLSQNSPKAPYTAPGPKF